MTRKIAVMLCRCHGKIKGIDFKRLKELAEKSSGVVHVSIHDDLCSEIKYISAKLKNIDAILVVGCTPRTHEENHLKILREYGIDVLHYVNIREQCSWCHTDYDEMMNKKAAKMVEMGVEYIRRQRPSKGKDVKFLKNVLVIGGGVAGMQSALTFANSGYKVYLVEKNSKLGGRTYDLVRTYPTHECKVDGCCMRSCRECILTPKIENVLNHTNIRVFLEAEVTSIGGKMGEYSVEIQKAGHVEKVYVGGIVIATGSKMIDISDYDEYLYQHPKVITSLELEHLLEGYSRDIKRVNFIQCVGSRDRKRGKEYCSIVCCTYAIGQAKELKKKYPDAEIFVHYMDLRGPYRGFEEHYAEARDMGIVFLRGRVSKIFEDNGKLYIKFEDLDSGNIMIMETSLVVLSVGQEPSEGIENISNMLGLPTDRDNFLRDYNASWDISKRKGIIVVGCASGPKGIRYSVSEAILYSEMLKMAIEEGIKSSEIHAVVDVEKCAGCGICEKVCEENAIKLEVIHDYLKKKLYYVSKVDVEKCTGCGACEASCPSKVININVNSYESINDALEVLM